LQADDAVGFFALGREHDDVDVRFLAQAAADLQPVEAGQHQIQHHQVGPEGAGLLQSGAAIVRRLHHKALTLQIRAPEIDDVGLVVDHEYAFTGHSVRRIGTGEFDPQPSGSWASYTYLHFTCSQQFGDAAAHVGPGHGAS